MYYDNINIYFAYDGLKSVSVLDASPFLKTIHTKQLLKRGRCSYSYSPLKPAATCCDQGRIA